MSSLLKCCESFLKPSPWVVMKLLLFSSLSFQQPHRIWGELLRKHGLNYQKHVDKTSLYILSSSPCISIVIRPRLCWSCALMRSVHEGRWRWTWQRRVLTGQKCIFWRTRRPGTFVFHWRYIPYTDKCNVVCIQGIDPSLLLFNFVGLYHLKTQDENCKLSRYALLVW